LKGRLLGGRLRLTDVNRFLSWARLQLPHKFLKYTGNCASVISRGASIKTRAAVAVDLAGIRVGHGLVYTPYATGAK
jgi:hypothetical protein